MVPLKLTLLFLLAVLILPVSLPAAELTGKTMIADQAAAGGEVFAYPVTALNFSEPPPYRSVHTKDDGLFEIELPAGQYYLMAKKNGYFAYYGRNPVSVPETGLANVNILLLPDALPVPKHEGLVETGVAGVITSQGQPVAGAVVMVYTDLTSQLKGMGLGMSSPTGADGVFEFPLSPGKYYLVVRARKSGMVAGPLQAGDLFGYLSGNPLAVTEGQVAMVNIPVITVPEKVERYASSLFGSTSIRGRILNASGQPVEGLQALLYEDPMMLNRPLYVSQPTGADGAFVLSFPEGGVYYLAARNELGGTPAPGELYGRYQGSPDHSVRVRTGKTLEEIEIRVEEVY